MHQRDLPGGIAPHIPVDAYHRAQATGQPVVIVVNDTRASFPWRGVLIPFAIAGAAVLGTWGLVAAVCHLLDPAADTATRIARVAGPIGIGGITLRLFRSKHR